MIRNVEVKPSPSWLVRRLQAIGMRPINNVADATNYVLMELGHPLHAFDLARLADHRIVVRRARAGETLKTLDGVTRALTPENLMIADATRPVALAGIMGGAESAITPATRSVLLESAWFDPVSIRRTAKAHGLHTEASHRFERGANVEMVPLALDRAAELIRELAGGEMLRGLVEVYPAPKKRGEIILRPSEIRRALGTGIAAKEVERILPSLGFSADRNGTDGWIVTPPSFRLDVTREVDLIEEVARHFGYDQLPARVVPAPPRAERDLLREKELILDSVLVSLGFREIITSSMIDPAENLKFSGSRSVVLENPLSQEASALRTTMLPSMIAALSWNLNRGAEDLRFFETGKVYWKDSDGKPKERRILALGLAGHSRPAAVYESERKREGEDERQSPRELTFFDLKGVLEVLFAGFDVGAARFRAEAAQCFENGLGGQFLHGEASMATLGQLKLSLQRDYKLRQVVWLAEIDLEGLLERPLKPKSFRAFSKFPAVDRDFSLMVPSEAAYSQIAEAIEGIGLAALHSFKPVERFDHPSIGTGQYSLLLGVTYQSSTHTLTG
ncbi:MAG: phenylalanine--tRNA ligase subunit beta, partial [Terriglobia bacterium]